MRLLVLTVAAVFVAFRGTAAEPTPPATTPIQTDILTHLDAAGRD